MNRYLVTKITGYCKTVCLLIWDLLSACRMIKAIPYNSKNALTGLNKARSRRFRGINQERCG